MIIADQPMERLFAGRRQAERRSRRQAMIAVPLLTAFYAVATIDRENFASQPWIVESTAVFILCAALIPLLCDGSQGVFDPFNPKNLFLLTFALQFGLYPLFILNGGTRVPLYGYSAGSGMENYYIEAQLLAALGLVCYLLGYSSRLAWYMERMLPQPRALDPERVKTISLFLFLGGYLGAACVFWKEGGLTRFLENREQWRSGGLSGSGVFVMPASLWLPAAALLPMIQLTRAQDLWRKVAARIGLLIICLIPVYLLGFRALIVMPILECIVILHYLRHRISVVRSVAVGLIIAGSMTLYALSRVRAVLDWELIAATGGEATLEYLFFRTPGIDLVATILNDSRSRGFEYGITSGIEAATILVPRGLWTNKPLSWGEQYTTRYFGDYLSMGGDVRETYGGINSTAIGYFYLQLGVAGVAGGMFILGAASRMIYSYGLRFAGPNTAFLLFILLWPLPIMASEGPQNALNQLVIIVACAWVPLSCWAARSKSHKPIGRNLTSETETLT
jgi:hypothetical protein